MVFLSASLVRANTGSSNSARAARMADAVRLPAGLAHKMKVPRAEDDDTLLAPFFSAGLARLIKGNGCRSSQYPDACGNQVERTGTKAMARRQARRMPRYPSIGFTVASIGTLPMRQAP
jgi:hypothetical protein